MLGKLIVLSVTKCQDQLGCSAPSKRVRGLSSGLGNSSPACFSRSLLDRTAVSMLTSSAVKPAARARAIACFASLRSPTRTTGTTAACRSAWRRPPPTWWPGWRSRTGCQPQARHGRPPARPRDGTSAARRSVTARAVAAGADRGGWCWCPPDARRAACPGGTRCGRRRIGCGAACIRLRRRYRDMPAPRPEGGAGRPWQHPRCCSSEPVS